MQTLDIDLDAMNQSLRHESPQAIIEWALSLQEKTIATTSFGYYSAGSLHMISTNRTWNQNIIINKIYF